MIEGGHIHLEQSNGQYLDVSPTGFYGYNSGGSVRFQADRSMVTSAALGTSNSNVYLAPDSSNEVRVVDVTSIHLMVRLVATRIDQSERSQ